MKFNYIAKWYAQQMLQGLHASQKLEITQYKVQARTLFEFQKVPLKYFSNTNVRWSY